jgi:hypothetical protein
MVDDKLVCGRAASRDRDRRFADQTVERQQIEEDLQ